MLTRETVPVAFYLSGWESMQSNHPIYVLFRKVLNGITRWLRAVQSIPKLWGYQIYHYYDPTAIAGGKPGTNYATRENFVTLISAEKTILEIGPFYTPVVSGKNVSYFDILDSGMLLKRTKEIGYPVENIPFIDYVSPTGNLTIIDQEFSAVVSSHCIEHQPDLIKHLQQVAQVLEDHGRYFLLIPDKRYCFDHFIAESTVANIIDAHVNQRQVHRVGSVIEHRALTTHNDSARHWKGDHADADYLKSIPDRVKQALLEYEAAQGASIDVHAWQFTPKTFYFLMETLYSLGYIPLRPTLIGNTPTKSNEFCAILQKLRV